METVACDLCGSAECVAVTTQTDLLHHTTDEHFTVVRCTGCGLHYTNPRPGAAEIGRYYAEHYSFHAATSALRRFASQLAGRLANSWLYPLFDLVPPVGRRLITNVRSAIADPVLAFYAGGGSGSLLDIGCGAGLTASFWGERGALLAYRRITPVAGIEIDADARAILASHGVETWDGLDAVPADRHFGLIRMNWSLEHVHAPSTYFAFMRQRLQPGGRIIITVPNYDGMLYRLAPDAVELPIHLYHFKPNDIENYARRNGLRIVSLRTFSYPQMYMFAAQNGMLPPTFPQRLSLRAARAFQNTLQGFDKSGWGNDMLVELELA